MLLSETIDKPEDIVFWIVYGETQGVHLVYDVIMGFPLRLFLKIHKYVNVYHSIYSECEINICVQFVFCRQRWLRSLMLKNWMPLHAPYAKMCLKIL
jgi:hypothetical protein